MKINNHKVVVVTGFENRFSMELYATGICNEVSKLDNENLYLFKYKLNSKIQFKKNLIFRLLFYFEKYVISLFKSLIVFKEYDIIHIADQSYGFLLLLKFVLPKKIFIITVHDLIPIYYSSVIGKKEVINNSIAYRGSIYCTMLADSIIFPSFFTMNIYKKLYESNSKLFIIPHGVQIGTFNENENINNHLLCSKLNSKTVKIGIIDGERYKNPEKCIELVASFRRKFDSVHVYVMGRGSHLIRNILGHYDLLDNATFYFDMNELELNNYYNTIDLLIFFSEVEGLGQPLIEAFSRGIPVLASNIPVFQEISNNLYRLYPLEGESDTIVDDFLSHANTHEFITSIRNVKRICNNYNWSVSAKKFQKFYLNILSG